RVNLARSSRKSRKYKDISILAVTFLKEVSHFRSRVGSHVVIPVQIPINIRTLTRYFRSLKFNLGLARLVNRIYHFDDRPRRKIPHVPRLKSLTQIKTPP